MLEINNRKNTGKLTVMKQLISNNHYAKKEITEEIRKYLRKQEHNIQLEFRESSTQRNL